MKLIKKSIQANTRLEKKYENLKKECLCLEEEVDK